MTDTRSNTTLPTEVGTEEMVEAVARAICVSHYPYETHEDHWEQLGSIAHEHWLRSARAAIAAASPLLRAQRDRETALEYERRILAAEVEGVKAEKAMREAAAHKATSFLVGNPALGIPLRNPMAHEIADAIRELPLTLGNEDVDAISSGQVPPTQGSKI